MRSVGLDRNTQRIRHIHWFDMGLDDLVSRLFACTKKVARNHTLADKMLTNGQLTQQVIRNSIDSDLVRNL